MVSTLRQKITKGTATAVCAGALTVSMGLGQAAPAEAFLPLLFAPVLVGSTGMTLGAVLGTTSLISSIGWGIAGVGAATALGVGAYQTRDYWLPVVSGDFGKAEASETDPGTGAAIVYSGSTGTQGQTHPAEPAPGSSMQKVKPGTIMGSPPLDFNQTLNGVNMRVSYSGQDGAFIMSLDVSLYCKRPDNTTYKTSYEWKPILSGNGGGYPTSTTGKTYCQQSTHSLLGAVAGNFGGDPRLRPKVNDTGWGVENIVEFGTTEPWSPSTAPEAAFDPGSAEVKYKTTVECVRPDGSLFSVSAESTGADGGGKAVKFPSCHAASPGSHSTMKTEVEALVPGKTAPQPLWSMPQAQPEPDKPLCDPRKPGNPCKLAVKVDQKECLIGQWECENWLNLSRDPNQAPRVSCQYGPYVVPLETCNPLERAYEEGGAPATEENIDGNPDTRSDTMPNGEPQPKENTGTGTSTGTVPGTTTTPGAAGNPSPSNPEANKCWPSGWGMLNPVEWVLKPVGCALEAAFKPQTQTVQARADRITEKINKVGFGPVTSAWVNTFDDVGGGSGCAGPTVTFSFGGTSQSLQPFNACSQPMSTVAGITYAFSSVVIVLAGGLGIARAIGSGFGFNFTLGRGASE